MGSVIIDDQHGGRGWHRRQVLSQLNILLTQTLARISLSSPITSAVKFRQRNAGAMSKLN